MLFSCMSIWYVTILMPRDYLLLTGHRTSLEHLAIKPLGAEALEIDIGEGGSALEKSSEYPCSFHASAFGT